VLGGRDGVVELRQELGEVDRLGRIESARSTLGTTVTSHNTSHLAVELTTGFHFSKLPTTIA